MTDKKKISILGLIEIVLLNRLPDHYITILQPTPESGSYTSVGEVIKCEGSGKEPIDVVLMGEICYAVCGGHGFLDPTIRCDRSGKWLPPGT